MLGFTLSKLNLLMLVTALFAIISFFLFVMTNHMVSELAQQRVNDYGVIVDSVVKGELLCRTSSFIVPESIPYFGGLMPSRHFYYVMYIKRYPEEVEEGELTTLIFQIAKRTERDQIIATNRVDMNASIFLYEWDSKTDLLTEQSTITIDPLSSGIEAKNSVVLIKEVYEGRKSLHMVACSSSAGICEVNKKRASCIICDEQDRISTCFPNPEGCQEGIDCEV